MSRLQSRRFRYDFTEFEPPTRWGAILGGVLGAMQLAAIPMLGIFTPLPEVQRAARVPSILGAVLQLLNG